MSLIIRPFRLLLKALLVEATPGQLAFGFAFGILIGLVPKGNLTAISLGVILAASRANLGVAGATALAFSFVSPYCDPLSHRIGEWLLGHPSLKDMWTRLYNTPVMPWTDFNNTVVLGSLVLGIALLYPAYRITRPVFGHYTERVQKWAKKFRLTRLLMGVEWADRLGASGS